MYAVLRRLSAYREESTLAHLMIGQTLSHYRITSKLGSGGMGDVYLADDIGELERNVALKVIPAELAADPQRMQRFVQEARAVSALNHPNILTVFEFGQEGETRFIATEYVEGKTLRQYSNEASLGVSEVLDIATQIAAALDAAHGKGVVHRDIKPENVMVRKDGIVKVLDFGLAKLVERERDGGAAVDTEAGTLAHTAPGLVMGTVPYMSPEQARGAEVDARTDVWSLGVVVYEMLSGRKPFEGETNSDRLAAILTAEPKALEDNEIPDDLKRIVRKTLKKERDARYQTMKGLLADLKDLKEELSFSEKFERSTSPDSRPSSETRSTQIANAEKAERDQQEATTSSAEYVATQIGKHKVGVTFGIVVLLVAAVAIGGWAYISQSGSSKQIGSIAVMPFVNESGDMELEYLSDGMTETLINSLSQLPNLKVKARSSVFHYKGKETSAQTIGRELNVEAILTGRVVQRRQDLLLYLELVDAVTGDRLWGEQYDRKQANLIALQNEIARDVAKKLEVTLSGTDEQRLAKNSTENVEAYQLYLKGRYHWNKRTVDELREAAEDFQKAIDVEPNFALAYAGLADSYSLIPEYGGEPPHEMMPKARAAALKALALDENLAEAHTAYGPVLLSYDHDFVGAEREYRRAIELNPNYATAHQYYAELLGSLGRTEEALAEIRRARELDPLSLIINRTYGVILFQSRQYDEALAQLNETVELDSSFPSVHYNLGFVQQFKGNYAESAEEFAKWRELGGDAQGAALAREGFSNGGWEGFLQAVTGPRRPADLSTYLLAAFHVALGEKDKAMVKLAESYDNRVNIIFWLKVDPRFDKVRDDPRFQTLVRKIGYP